MEPGRTCRVMRISIVITRQVLQSSIAPIILTIQTCEGYQLITPRLLLRNGSCLDDIYAWTSRVATRSTSDYSLSSTWQFPSFKQSSSRVKSEVHAKIDNRSIIRILNWLSRTVSEKRGLRGEAVNNCRT